MENKESAADHIAPQENSHENEQSETNNPTVPNPFEEGSKQLSKEESENVELFKEAQTERD